MWTRRTLQIILGGYLIYGLFLLATLYCLPLTLNDILSLPFEVLVINPHRLPLNMGTVLMMGLALVFWLEQARAIRLISLATEARRKELWIKADTAGEVSPSLTAGAIVLILLTLIAEPAFILLQDWEKTAYATSLEDIEKETRGRLASVARPLTELETPPSPDRAWDSLPYTKLPVLRLEVPEFSRVELKKALPRYKDGFNQNTAFSVYSKGTEHWPYVPAFFTYAGVRYPVDVRYRGWNFDHYLGFKKSWRIKFHKNDLFKGRRQFNIINQRDHSAINDLLWSEALRESGIMTPYQFLVHLRIDDDSRGIHTFLEQPDRYFAERHNRNASDVYGEEKPIVRIDGFTKAESWQQYCRAGESNDITPLLDLYAAALDKEHPEYLTRLENLLDIDHYLKFLAHATITCAEEPSSHNIRWIRDPGIGRFQILPWYQASSRFIIKGHYQRCSAGVGASFPPAIAINDLADGLLRHPQLRQTYLRHIWRMLLSTHHHGHLKGKLDELYLHVRSDARADTHMHYRYDMNRYVSNAEWEDTILRLREMLDDRLQFLEQQIQGGPLRLSWRPEIKDDTAKLGRLEIVTTNYCDSALRRLVFKCPSNWTGKTLALATPSQKVSATVMTTANASTVTFLLNQPISARVKRIPIPLGPGIFIADLGAIKNPEIEYQGGVSQLAPHYQPQPTTNTFLLTASTAGNLGPISLATIDLRNPITGRLMPSTGSDAHLKADRPAYSKTAALTLQSLPVPNPRHPEATLAFTEPDGVSLGDSRVQTAHPIVFEAGIHHFQPPA